MKRTYKASLTFLSKILEQLARLLVNFIVIPLIVGGLGQSLYGVWRMIIQSIGYLSTSDLRPMATLKYTLAVRQHKDDINEKKRQIGAAIIVWFIALPVFCVVGFFVVSYFPLIVDVTTHNLSVIKIALLIMVIGTAMDRIFSLPANILRGMNQEYQAMGLNAIMVIVSGGLIVLAMHMKSGLIGLAVATILGLLLSGMVRFVVAKRILSWIGILKPYPQELLRFLKLSFWLFLLGISELVLYRSDILLVGILGGPTLAAVYSLTNSIFLLLGTQVEQIIYASMPGVAGICGTKNWPLLNKIRYELFIIGFSAMSFLGIFAVLFNRSFLELWVGESFYGGGALTLLLAIVAFENFFLRVQSAISDSLLAFRERTLINSVSGLIVVILAIALFNVLGAIGIVIAYLVAKLVLLFQIEYFLRKMIPIEFTINRFLIVRKIYFVAPLIMIAYWARNLFKADNWINFIAISVIASLFIIPLVAYLGLSASERKLLFDRLGILWKRLNVGVR
ncbi:MAG: hypothetical protein MJA29_03275 [Candidatus Omnitrophica bacterium]|nr:hypothetical protein [Candidatus Omnitrophota bacterium]